MNSTEPAPDYRTEPLAVPLAAISAPPPRRRTGWIWFLVIFAFIGGVAASWWVMQQWPTWLGTNGSIYASNPSPPPNPIRQQVVTGVPAAPQQVLPGPGLAEQAVAMRVAEMEDRLARISVQAQAASSNAARAEGLLIAIAARRALDNGAPLGYIEGQLRLRFGQAQPRAVATIINAARQPVTLADLQAGLADIAPLLVSRGPDEGWWLAVQREMGSLIVFREAGTPLPTPEARMERATRYLNAGRVDAALTEVSGMPGRAVADRWMQMARRYNEARRALGLIETAAILEQPRQLPVMASPPPVAVLPIIPE